MFKKMFPSLALLLLLTSIFVLSYQVKPAGAAIIYVPDSYTTIQSAINHATGGDTIIVRANRTYNEDVVLNKSVTLHGENKYTTVIQGVAPSNTTARVLYVTASNASVTGFTIKDANPEHDKSGIVLYGVVNCNISGNILPEDTYAGINIGGSSRYNKIVANTFTNNGLVVSYGSYPNTIVNNTVNSKSLVYLENAANLIVSGTWIGQVILMKSTNITVVNLNLSHTSIAVQVRSSNNNKIINNTWTNNYEGISVSNSSNNQITGNKIKNNAIGVVFLAYASNSSFSGNDIVNSEVGLYLSTSSNSNNVFGNNITANSWLGIWIRYATDNKIHHNNFINNTTPTDITPINATNTWDDGYPSGGNYWSSFSGTDTHKGPYQNQTGSDEISDTQYTINGFNKDRYPLMGPVGPSTVPTGTNVTAFPTPDAALTFDQVTVSGAVTGNASPTGPLPPTGYVMLGQYYDIKVAATYSGNITVRIIYDDSGMTSEEEASLRMGQIDLIPGDINKDGKVNLIDVFAVALAFGSYPGHPRWNPKCDINGDGKVDLKDYFTTAKNFNKSAQWQIITTYVDTANNLIYGETSHFSLIGIHSSA